MRNAYPYFLATALALAAANWVSDSITLKGHWTVYTARCDGGTWQGSRCTGGRLVAAERYQFIANKARAQVVFEAIGTATAYGKLSECTIEDGRDWACLTAIAGVHPIPRRLAGGKPVGPADFPGDARPVPKWKWVFLRLGVPVGSEVQA
jgi:hypothetical protein